MGLLKKDGSKLGSERFILNKLLFSPGPYQSALDRNVQGGREFG